MDANETPKRKWYRKKRWRAALMLWLGLPLAFVPYAEAWRDAAAAWPGCRVIPHHVLVRPRIPFVVAHFRVRDRRGEPVKTDLVWNLRLGRRVYQEPLEYRVGGHPVLEYVSRTRRVALVPIRRFQ